MRPWLFGIRPGVLVGFYTWRLRQYGMQELLAGAGIAVGVALVFGVLVAQQSLIGSAGQTVHGMVGEARMQLAARGPDGFDQRLATVAAATPGIERTAPLLRTNVAVLGPYGRRRAVQLIGVTPALSALGGVCTQGFGQGGLRFSNGIALPARVAAAIGVAPGQDVTVLAAGRATRVHAGVLPARTLPCGLDQSPIAAAALPVAQVIAGLRGRISQLLVEPSHGADTTVTVRLRALAGGRLHVGPADDELALLREAAKPNEQSTAMFAAIAALVGILLALNAMLLTVPERRRFIAELRTAGAEPAHVIVVLLFEACVLGLTASAVGVALGDVLCRTLFDQVPAYLAFAFPIGSGRIIATSTVVLSLAGGIAATVLASAPPLLDLRRRRPVDAVFREIGEAGQELPAPARRALLGGAAALVAAATALVLLAPAWTIAGGIALALATLCLVPSAFLLVADLAGRLSRRLPGSMAALAVLELRATTLRAIALAGVGALAVFGSVAIGGAREDLVRGLDANFHDYLATTDAWVTTGGDDLTTNPFHADGLATAIARAPGVAAVRSYEGSLLDVGRRRMWVIGRPPDDRTMLPASQLERGDVATATARLRAGGWAAISDGFAAERHLRVGDRFTIPTPTGSLTLRVAAVTTNLGWPPGAIVLNRDDYRRAWATADPSALQVDFKPGVKPATGKQAVQAALGDRPGLRVQTTGERERQYAALSRQGLRSLSQISALLLIAAGLAVAAAFTAAVWERRRRLTDLREQGADHLQLWRALMVESAVVLITGCGTGALLGLYGHALASRYLQLTTGFPAPLTYAPGPILAALGSVTGIACLVVAIPGYRAARGVEAQRVSPAVIHR